MSNAATAEVLSAVPADLPEIQAPPVKPQRYFGSGQPVPDGYIPPAPQAFAQTPEEEALQEERMQQIIWQFPVIFQDRARQLVTDLKTIKNLPIEVKPEDTDIDIHEAIERFKAVADDYKSQEFGEETISKYLELAKATIVLTRVRERIPSGEDAPQQDPAVKGAIAYTEKLLFEDGTFSQTQRDLVQRMLSRFVRGLPVDSLDNSDQAFIDYISQELINSSREGNIPKRYYEGYQGASMLDAYIKDVVRYRLGDLTVEIVEEFGVRRHSVEGAKLGNEVRLFNNDKFSLPVIFEVLDSSDAPESLKSELKEELKNKVNTTVSELTWVRGGVIKLNKIDEIMPILSRIMEPSQENIRLKELLEAIKDNRDTYLYQEDGSNLSPREKQLLLVLRYRQGKYDEIASRTNYLNDEQTQNIARSLFRTLTKDLIEKGDPRGADYMRRILSGLSEETNPFQIFQELKPYLSDEVLKGLRDETRNQWETIISFDARERLQRILIEHADQLGLFIQNGQLQPAILERGIIDRASDGPIDELLTKDEINAFPPRDRDLWNYILSKRNPAIRLTIYELRDRFGELVVDGKATKELCELFASRNTIEFMQFADKDDWRTLLGEDVVNRFLDALPKRTDEKRNAFTHNKFDRTTLFLMYLSDNNGIDLTPEYFEIITKYISSFGLAKSAFLFDYVESIELYNRGVITELPFEMTSSGIDSVEALKAKLDSVTARIYSDAPITDLRELSDMDKKFLEVLTGFSTHSWGRGRRIDRIMEDFEEDMSHGEIAPVPQGYEVEKFSLPHTVIEFDPKPIQADHDVLSSEIVSAIENPQRVDDLTTTAEATINKKIAEINERMPRAGAGERVYNEKTLAELSGYVGNLRDVSDLDSLVTALLDMKFDRTEQKVINSVLRQVVFRKIISRNISPEVVAEMQNRLMGEVSPQSILSIVNVVDHIAKAHVLNLDGDNKEHYWAEEAFAKIKGSKRGRNLTEIFSPHAQNLRKAVNDFQAVEVGGVDEVRMIPDRGLIGEMSGYLADACYTAEYPLLKKFPRMVPYKFVVGEGVEARFLGSVLVFEVPTSDGTPALLVRAFDVPDEQSIDVEKFIETFLDSMVEVARGRGAKQVLVPGSNGAISNYQMTIHHIQKKYVSGQNPVELSERFAFNGYDLTNDSYVARTVPVN